jgi:hypothetical protein
MWEAEIRRIVIPVQPQQKKMFYETPISWEKISSGWHEPVVPEMVRSIK